MLRQNCILVCSKTTQNNQCKLVVHSSSHRKTARHVKVVWNLIPESMVKEKKTKTQDIWLCRCTGSLEGKVHGSESHNIMLGPGNRPSGCIGSHQGCSLATFCKLWWWGGGGGMGSRKWAALHVGLQRCIGSQGPALLYGSRWMYWQRPALLYGSREMYWQRQALLYGSSGLYQQSGTNTPVCPGGCSGSQGPALLCVCRGL